MAVRAEAPPTATPVVTERTELRFHGEAMACSLSLVVSAPAIPHLAALAEEAWVATRTSFERAEQALSRFRDTSDLTALNRRTGQDVAVSRILARALAAADRANRRTGGRFDPRVLVALERIGYSGAALDAVAGATRGTAGSPSDRDRVVSRTGRTTVRITVPIDLGGIGKGLALRWAANELARGPLAALLAAGGGFLLDAGQDIATRGAGPVGADSRVSAGAWLVDIEDPGLPSDALAVIALPPGWAVATSSTRARRWTGPGGGTVHHLIDPRTGEPGGDGLTAVTVAGTDPAWAEVWGKSLFLEGRHRIATAARRQGLAAWWVTTDGLLEMTPAARPMTAWLRAG